MGVVPLAVGSHVTAGVSVALGAGGGAGVWARLLQSCVGGLAPVIDMTNVKHICVVYSLWQ